MSTERETETLAAQLAELANRPPGDTRLERARARAIELARRATTWGPFAPVAEIGWRTLRRDAAIGGSVLGVAAGLLFGFFLFGRAIELAAALNATLVEERRRRVPR